MVDSLRPSQVRDWWKWTDGLPPFTNAGVTSLPHLPFCSSPKLSFFSLSLPFMFFFTFFCVCCPALFYLLFFMIHLSFNFLLSSSAHPLLLSPVLFILLFYSLYEKKWQFSFLWISQPHRFVLLFIAPYCFFCSQFYRIFIFVYWLMAFHCGLYGLCISSLSFENMISSFVIFTAPGWSYFCSLSHLPSFPHGYF